MKPKKLPPKGRPLKEVRKMVKELLNQQYIVNLCLQFQKEGGGRSKIREGRTLPVKVIDVQEDHIMVVPRNDPEKVRSIDWNTYVSTLQTGSVCLKF